MSTILDSVLERLAQAAAFNRGVVARPAAILWPDEGRQWAAAVSLLRGRHPALLTLGDYQPERGQVLELFRSETAAHASAAYWEYDMGDPHLLAGSDLLEAMDRADVVQVDDDLDVAVTHTGACHLGESGVARNNATLLFTALSGATTQPEIQNLETKLRPQSPRS